MDKLESYFFILLLGEVKLKLYNINSKTNLILYIWSAFIIFFGINRSDRDIVDNSNYNITTNTSLENISISTLSSLLSHFQILIFSKSQDIANCTFWKTKTISN